MNKFYIIKSCILLILILSLCTFAEVSFGVNLSTYLSIDRKTNEVPQGEEYERTTTYALNLYPALIIVPTGKFEIVPTLGFSFQKEKRVEEDVDGNERERWDHTDFGVGGGCGFFLRAIEGNVLRLTLGPDAFVWFYNPNGRDDQSVDVSVGFPANVDFLLNERIFLRLGSRLVTVRYVYQKEGEDEHTNSFTVFDIESMLQATLGFFFTF